MKKLATLILAFMLMLTTAYAEIPDISALTADEKAELLTQLLTGLSGAEINEGVGGRLTDYTDDELAALAELISAEQATRGTTYITLQKGDKGEAVVRLQQRFIELSYLSGSADGDYGNKTKTAVELFQREAGLTVTGIADAETQEKLFAEDAPQATVYLELDFNAISRDPDTYDGKNYTFSGKVLQVMEQENGDYVQTQMRIATKGNYDNVVYVVYDRPAGEARILEDDRVTVYATYRGLYSYTAVMGNEITLPLFYAESVMLK